MKTKFQKMSQEAFETCSPKHEREMDDYREEARFREWCKANSMDPEAEESRECFLEADANQGNSAWEDMDDDEREGWEHNMNKD